MHTVVDGRFRGAYAEIHNDETAATASNVFKHYYATGSARRNALPVWVHHYSRQMPHTAIGGRVPITRLSDLPGQHVKLQGRRALSSSSDLGPIASASSASRRTLTIVG